MRSKELLPLLATALVGANLAAVAGPQSNLDPYASIQAPAQMPVDKKQKKLTDKFKSKKPQMAQEVFQPQPGVSGEFSTQASNTVIQETGRSKIAKPAPGAVPVQKNAAAPKEVETQQVAGGGEGGFMGGAKQMTGAMMEGTKTVGAGIATGAKKAGGGIMTGARAVGHGMMVAGGKMKEGTVAAGGKVAGGTKALGSGIASAGGKAKEGGGSLGSKLVAMPKALGGKVVGGTKSAGSAIAGGTKNIGGKVTGGSKPAPAPASENVAAVTDEAAVTANPNALEMKAPIAEAPGANAEKEGVVSGAGKAIVKAPVKMIGGLAKLNPFHKKEPLQTAGKNQPIK